MFGIGGQELILLCLIGLIVLGPEKLPRVANQVGNWLGQARRMTRVLKRQLEEEIELVKREEKKPPAGSREPSQQPAAIADQSNQGTPRDDDEFSPAHAVDEPGTGSAEDPYEDASDLAVTEAERARLAAEATDEEPPVPVADKKAVS